MKIKLKRKLKKIELFALLVILFLGIEYLSEFKEITPMTEICISGIVELIKGIFMGTIFTLFVEENEEK